ncbi:MAG: hypothetical protein B7X59_15410, partial [Polaromonas sp. 39-63-203]
MALGRQLQRQPGQRLGQTLQRRAQRQRQLLFAELAHQRRLVFHHNQLALADHADPVGHFLGLFDVVR